MKAKFLAVLEFSGLALSIPLHFFPLNQDFQNPFRAQ
jgi:hypothetical protein